MISLKLAGRACRHGAAVWGVDEAASPRPLGWRPPDQFEVGGPGVSPWGRCMGC